jgi:hypothetical protein
MVLDFYWHSATSLASKSYTCGYCGNPLASQKGYAATQYPDGSGQRLAYIYVCHFCNNPTYFDINGYQVPGSAFGRPVEHVPEQDVAPLYEEARNCMKVNAYTAAILCCRKLLMNIAVKQGAKEGRRFAEYVSYLADSGFLPPNGKKWVDEIRKKGNEATHEIAIMTREDAEELIEFSEMLLRFIYEYPTRIDRKVQQAQANAP